MNHRLPAVLAFGLGVAAASAAGEELPAAPALVTVPMPFLGITPCRIVDTRDATRPPGYGPPSLAAGVPRSFTIAGRCGIPAGAAAVSLNVTVVSPQGLGYVLLYPQGGSQPGVSTVNYVQGQTVANAAVVPLGAGGGITVAAAVSGTDFLIDTNGYFGGSAGDAGNVFLGTGAGNASTTAAALTAAGFHALASDTTANSNTAAGENALLNATSGQSNVAVGVETLALLQDGAVSEAFGVDALAVNASGEMNTAIGVGALVSSAGTNSTAVGKNALQGASGFSNNNAALGQGAGSSLTTGGSALYVANDGVSDDSGVIRLGVGGIQTKTFVAGVRGVTLGGGLLVQIDVTGQLGVATSSARSKEAIFDMADASGPLQRLRPVAFHYKDQPGRTSYGLIAEEVERALPDLVVCDGSGEALTVRYDEIPALLLNELQKQKRRLADDQARLAERRESLESRERSLDTREAQIRELEGRIGALEQSRDGRLP